MHNLPVLTKFGHMLVKTAAKIHERFILPETRKVWKELCEKKWLSLIGWQRREPMHEFRSCTDIHRPQEQARGTYGSIKPKVIPHCLNAGEQIEDVS